MVVEGCSLHYHSPQGFLKHWLSLIPMLAHLKERALILGSPRGG